MEVTRRTKWTLPLLLVGLSVAGVAVSSAATPVFKSDKDAAAWMLERTCWIGNCSGVVLPPAIDSKGRTRWFVASAAHCAHPSREYDVQFVYPSTNRRRVKGREVYRRRGGQNDNTDIMIIEVFPARPLPHAKFAQHAPAPGSAVMVTGFPERKMKWKHANVKQVSHGSIEIDSYTWKGNSGGPLWFIPKDKSPQVVGTNSTSDFQTFAFFSDTNSVHEGYHAAANKIGATCLCGWGPRRQQQQPPQHQQPYQPPPNEELIALQQYIIQLEQRITTLENAPPGQPGRDGEDGRDGVDGTNGNDGAPGVAGADGEDGRNGAPGKQGAIGVPGRDGERGQDGADGRDGAPGIIDVIVRWQDGTVIGTQQAAHSGGTVVVTLSKHELESR